MTKLFCDICKREIGYDQREARPGLYWKLNFIQTESGKQYGDIEFEAHPDCVRKAFGKIAKEVRDD